MHKTRVGRLLYAVAAAVLHVLEQEFVDSERHLTLVGHDAVVLIELLLLVVVDDDFLYLFVTHSSRVLWVQFSFPRVSSRVLWVW